LQVSTCAAYQPSPCSCLCRCVLMAVHSRTGIPRMVRVGQNRIYTPYMTVYLVNSLPKIPYIHRINVVLANPTYSRTLRAHSF
jgi:hypothetical protein